MAEPPSSDDPEAAERPARKRPAPFSTDLIGSAKTARFRGVVGSPEPLRELKARLIEERAGADQARTLELRRAAHAEWRDRFILKWGVAATASVGVCCLVLSLVGVAPQDRVGASLTLAGLVGGLVGYVIGAAGK